MVATTRTRQRKNNRRIKPSAGGNGSPQRDRKLIIVNAPGKYTALGYRAARLASSEGRVYSGAAGQRHEQFDRIKLINQSRAFMRDNSIYRGMINRAVAYIVGNGFGLQVKTSSKNLNSEIEAMWEEEHRRPEVRQVLTGRKTDRMICREILVTGDTAVLLTNKDSKIQLIESEQITKSTISNSDGIETDVYGRPKKFWISSYDKNGFTSKSRSKPFRPENVLFLTNPERPSSLRGVPPCQSAFPMLHRINDVCDSEAIAWQLLARLAVAIYRKEGAKQGYNESKANPDKEGTAGEGSLSTRITELDYALMFEAEPDEKIEGIERNIPGKNFSESLRMFLRLLGLPIGLPLELILLDWTQSNYSQSRAILEQAYQTFLDSQYGLKDFYYDPLLIWRVKNKIHSKTLEKNGYQLNHHFIMPTFPWIDQLKEVQAYAEKLDRSFITHSDVCKSLNRDREDVVSTRETEVSDAIERAKKISEKYSVEVPWEIFAGLEPPTKKEAKQAAQNLLQAAGGKKKKQKDEDEN